MGPRSYSHVCLLSHPSTVPSRPLQLLACPRHGDGALPYMANASSSLVVEMGFLTVEHSSGQQPFSRVFYAPPGATLWLHRSTTTVASFEISATVGNGTLLLLRPQMSWKALRPTAFHFCCLDCTSSSSSSDTTTEIVSNFLSNGHQACMEMEDGTTKTAHSQLLSRHK